MTPFLCIIIDDDLSALEHLAECIALSPHLDLYKSYTDPILSIKEIEALEAPIDILFTDIEMPNVSGIELAARTAKNVKSLILVSAYPEYLNEGYAVKAKQFLSKPFDYRKFEKLMQPVINGLAEDYIIIKLSGKNRMVRIYHEEIIAIESVSNYLKVHTKKKTYIPYGSIREMEENLNAVPFLKRINRSLIINTRFISETSKYNVKLENNIEANVGENYRKDFDGFLRMALYNGSFK